MKHKILSSDFYTLKKENDAIKICINSLPTLYKYQTITDYSLTNFNNGEIWGTVPNAFNDPYDSICCHTDFEIKNAINNLLTVDRLDSYKTCFETTKRTEIIEKLKSFLLDNNNENFRKQYCVSCYSIYNDSEIMWGHYADCAKGFVIGYNGNDLKKCAFESNKLTLDMLKSFNPFNVDFSEIQEDNYVTILPIIYSNSKVNNTNNIIKFLPQIFEYFDDVCQGIEEAIDKYLNKIKQIFYSNLHQNNNLFYSIMCTKNKCWGYEQEWRIWAYNSNVLTGNYFNPYVKIGYAPAQAIYLGEKISTFNRMILLDIAKKQNIPVYQMKTKMYKHYCKLHPILIEN